MSQTCPCCDCSRTNLFITKDNYNYYQCKGCKTIFISTDILEQIDNGLRIVEYNENYWRSELSSSLERSYGIALARMSEIFYYSRSKINRFIDIGTGPGYFLDAVQKYLPDHSDVFYAIEKFPPSDMSNRTKSKNYRIGDLNVFKDEKFDAGMCIEVVEHITPTMFRGLLRDLSLSSNENAIYLFNTGMPEYVEKEDINYIDPCKRGHIVSYSLKAVELLSEEFGFKAHAIKGKAWAFVLEYKPTHTNNMPMVDRVWSALPENLHLLTDSSMGSVIKLLGLETSRAYY